jgi:hypothetical protein
MSGAKARKRMQWKIATAPLHITNHAEEKTPAAVGGGIAARRTFAHE